MEVQTPEFDPLKEQAKKIAKSLYELVEKNSSLLSAAIGQKAASFERKAPEDEEISDYSRTQEHTIWIFGEESKEDKYTKERMLKLEESGVSFPVVAFDNIGLTTAPDQTVTTPYDDLQWEGKDSFNRYLPAEILGPDGTLYRFTNRIYLDMNGNGVVEERVGTSFTNYSSKVEEVARESKKVDFQPKESDSRFRPLRPGDLEKVNSFLADVEEGKFVVYEYKFK